MHLSETEKKPLTFEKIAKGTNDYFWYRRTVSEGAKRPITYEFMKRRVVLAKDGQPNRTVWLIVRRTPREEANFSYFLIECRQVHPLENICLALWGWLGHKAVL